MLYNCWSNKLIYVRFNIINTPTWWECIYKDVRTRKYWPTCVSSRPRVINRPRVNWRASAEDPGMRIRPCTVTTDSETAIFVTSAKRIKSKYTGQIDTFQGGGGGREEIRRKADFGVLHTIYLLGRQTSFDNVLHSKKIKFSCRVSLSVSGVFKNERSPSKALFLHAIFTNVY